jgi:hypothetical protein
MFLVLFVFKPSRRTGEAVAQSQRLRIGYTGETTR